MGDVIDALKFAFMGSLQARNGQWGLWTDLVYADFGASKQGSRDFSIGGQPLPVGLDANLVARHQVVDLDAGRHLRAEVRRRGHDGPALRHAHDRHDATR